MKIQTEGFGSQYTAAVRQPFCNPLRVVEASAREDVFMDTGSARLMDSGTSCAVNGVVTGVTMLSAIPVVAVGLAAKAISSQRWATRALCVPAVPLGLVLGAGSACLHLVTGGAMTLVGIGGVLCGAGYLPIDLAQRELHRLADASKPAISA